MKRGTFLKFPTTDLNYIKFLLLVLRLFLKKKHKHLFVYIYMI